LIIVKPETVIGWHHKGFRLYWAWKVRHGQPGRPPVSKEIRHGQSEAACSKNSTAAA
jgi:hypothetical protein